MAKAKATGRAENTVYIAIMEKLANIFRLGVVLFTVSSSALAADPATDPRTAKVWDNSDTESQVSALTATNTDSRFGFEASENRGRLVVVTDNIEWAIPLRAISKIARSGNAAWTVNYQAKDGEATVVGGFEEAVLAGNSDLGTFGLPLGRLDRLEFTQTGQAAEPAKRLTVYDQDGHPRAGGFDAVLTLADGTRLEVTQLRRNQVFAQSLTDPTLLPVRPSYAIVCTNYTDFRLLRGETLQTIPFENIKTAEVLSGEEVIVRARSGTEATMKIPRREQEIIEGLNGSCGKGDFYVPLKFVRTIDFGEAAK
jgi:hypothetical protein